MDLNLNRFEVRTISIMTVDYSFSRKLNDYYLRYTEDRYVLPPQLVDATHALNLSAGVSNSKVFRGRSLS